MFVIEVGREISVVKRPKDFFSPLCWQEGEMARYQEMFLSLEESKASVWGHLYQLVFRASV